MAMSIDKNPHKRHGKYLDQEKKSGAMPILTLVAGLSVGFYIGTQWHKAGEYTDKKYSQSQEKNITKKDKKRTIENILTNETPKDTNKPRTDALKKEEENIKTDTLKYASDYDRMFCEFTNKGKNPAITNMTAINSSMMNEAEKRFYRYMVEGISRSMRQRNCDSTMMYCDAIEEAFPEAHKTNRRIAMDINAPDRKKSWAYRPMKECRIKFEW